MIQSNTVSQAHSYWGSQSVTTSNILTQSSFTSVTELLSYFGYWYMYIVVYLQ